MSNLFPTRAERGYDCEAVATFPWPIVAGYDDVHRWMDADLSVYAAWQLRDCWEGLLKFLATLAAADHLCAAEPGDPRTSKLLAALLFSRGISLGHWAGVLRTALADGTPAGVRLPELGPMFFDRRGKPTPFLRSLAEGPESFIAWRNHRFGHGVFGQDQSAFAQEATKWLDRLHEAYDAARPVLTEMALESDDPAGGPLTWGSVLPLAFYHAHQPADHAEAMLPVRVQVNGRAIDLTPLLSVQQCQVCGQWAAFYLDRYRDDQQRAWFLDFLNGHPRERRQLAVLGEWAGKVSDEDRRAASSGAAGLPEPDPERFRDFQAEFEPPVYLAEQAASFIREHDRGVLVVTGPAGVGKSWLCEGLDHSAMLPAVLGTKVEALRLTLHGGRTWTAAEVQAELREQARRVKRWPAPTDVDGPTPSARWSAWLAALMQQACLGRLIVALDGLDELPADSEVPDLFPPANELPRGCYLVLASRPENKAAVAAALKRVRSVAGSAADVAIGLASSEHRAVLLRYAEKQLRQPRRDRSDGLPAKWAKALVDRAEGRFLHVFHYCRALRYGVYADVSALPAPAEFYPRFFTSLRDCVGAELFEGYYAKTLAIIAAAREPIGMSLLTTCGLERGRLAAVLADLADLLHARREPWDEETLYSLGHVAIREFLREDAEWAGRVKDAHRFLAELTVRRFGSNWLQVDVTDLVERYLLLNLLDHTIEPDMRMSLLADVTLSTAFRRFAEVLFEKGQHLLRLKAYDAAIEILKLHVEVHGRKDLLRDLAHIYSNKGDALNTLDSWADGLNACQTGINILEYQLPPEARSGHWPVLVIAYLNLGNSLFGSGRLTDALTVFTSASQLCEKVALQKGQDDLLPNRARLEMSQGLVLTQLGRHKEALAAFAAGIELLEQLVDCGRHEMRADLAHVHLNRGMALFHLERHDEALAEFDAALEIYQELADVDGRSDLQADIANSHVNRGNALLGLGRAEEALSSLEVAAELLSIRIRQEGQQHLRSALALVHLNRGLALGLLGRFSEALTECSMSTSIREELVKQERRQDLAGDLAVTYATQANILTHIAEEEELVAQLTEKLLGKLGQGPGVITCQRPELQRAYDLAGQAVTILRAEVIRTNRSDLQQALDQAEVILRKASG